MIFVDAKYNFFDDFEINNFSDFKKCLSSYKGNYKNLKFNESINEFNYAGSIAFKFESHFLKVINTKITTKNWVDIENEYFKELKAIVKYNDSEENNRKRIVRLNQEFEQVKKLLEEYLIKVQDKFSNNFQNNIDWSKSFFNQNELEKNPDYMKGFSSKVQKEIEESNKSTFLIAARKSNKIKNYFLNSNYTNTIDSYESKYYGESVEQKQIHGRLNDKNNEMNFGFGDEMDSHYKEIENIDDNEYLKNFKSFQYSQNSNYKNLLDYIDSEKFQVYIMGHSCGLSDRTLLNTIFEHENCRSIEIFYYQEKDGTDNYTEIVQNISRHFNKKAMMREKIVNKSLCIPLPINIEPETLKK